MRYYLTLKVYGRLLGAEGLGVKSRGCRALQVSVNSICLHAAMLSVALLFVTSCTQSGPHPSGQAAQPTASSSSSAPSASAPSSVAKQAPSVAALKDKASMCGRSLGIAVRCNMLADQNDFAILRYNALNGLKLQAQQLADFSPVESAFDMSALEMMHQVAACQGSALAMTTLQQKIQGTMAECAQQAP